VGEGAVNETVGASATSQSRAHVERSFQLYHALLDMGVCREQARTVLPLSTYTEWYWKIDLANLFKFLRLRLDGHAQHEVQEFAAAKLWFIERLFPVCTAAFNKHALEAESLSGAEASVVKHLLAERVVSPGWLRERLGEKEAERFIARWKLKDVEVVP
jgi:thymidylate synthase (FAD)